MAPDADAARRAILGALTAIATLAPAQADNPVTWQIDQTINRGDGSQFWTSPTAIDLGFAKYVYDYAITKVEVTVRPLFSDVTIDITSQIAASFDLTGEGIAPQLPALLLEDSLSDSGAGTMADVRIEVDSAGFGQAAFTNIVLGSAAVPIFGQVDIQRVRLRAAVTLRGVLPGDYNGDGSVDSADYTAWAAAYGGATPSLVDGNDDGSVDAADYTTWRDRHDSPLGATATPEPGAALLALLCGGLFFGRGGRLG